MSNAAKALKMVVGVSSNSSSRDVTEAIIASFGGPQEFAHELHTIYEECKNDRLKVDILKMVFHGVLKFGEQERGGDASAQQDVRRFLHLMRDQDPKLMAQVNHVLPYVDASVVEAPA